MREPAAEPRRHIDPPFDVVQVRRHRGVETPRRIVERTCDLAERQTEPAEQADAVEPFDIRLRVEPMARVAPFRSDEQADLLVVVQRADGQTGRCRDFPDPPSGAVAFLRRHLVDRTT